MQQSSLLHAILRELPLKSGNIEISGTVSYASQEPWLFAGSIRQNILFGLPMDRERYRQVIIDIFRVPRCYDLEYFIFLSILKWFSNVRELWWGYSVIWRVQGCQFDYGFIDLLNDFSDFSTDFCYLLFFETNIFYVFYTNRMILNIVKHFFPSYFCKKKKWKNWPSFYKLTISKRESINAPCNLRSPSSAVSCNEKWPCIRSCKVFSHEIIKFIFKCNRHLMLFNEVEVKGVVLGKQPKERRKK